MLAGNIMQSKACGVAVANPLLLCGQHPVCTWRYTVNHHYTMLHMAQNNQSPTTNSNLLSRAARSFFLSDCSSSISSNASHQSTANWAVAAVALQWETTYNHAGQEGSDGFTCLLSRHTTGCDTATPFRAVALDLLLVIYHRFITPNGGSECALSHIFVNGSTHLSFATRRTASIQHTNDVRGLSFIAADTQLAQKVWPLLPDTVIITSTSCKQNIGLWPSGVVDDVQRTQWAALFH